MSRLWAAILSLVLVVASAAATLAQDIERRPIEDPLFAVSSVVPADWQDLGGGAYSRGTPPADLALIAIQSAPVTVDQLWPSLLPQFALTEVPQVTAQYSSDLFDWLLYRFDVTLGPTTLSVELALSENDGVTSLVLLQSDPEEFEILREQVLIPALDAFAPLAPEPTPDPSTFAYHIEEVSFPGGSEDVELAGTLTLPEGPGPHPVVVTMSGTGAHDRDESLRPITTLKPFALVADALTSAGVGVLRYDDRGVGGSSGDYGAATISELAEDARAAIDYLEGRRDVDPGRIGLFGHSEGGLYAAILGASDPRVAFIGLMAPGVVDGTSLIVEQNMAIARSSGSPEEMIEAIGEHTAEAMPLARDGEFEALERVTREFYGQVWDGFSADEQVLAGDRETFVQLQLDSVLPIYTSDWFRSFLAYDPTADWEQVTVPVLAVFGGKDVQVLAGSNEAALREALEAAGNEDVTSIVIADANHLFQEADSGALSEYAELEPAFIDGFLDTVVEWMVDRAGVAE
ncbi:MAG: alpha/beta fold hydrolase [Chloroflexota bacterium]|jgi:pimeloyl-ACP methyl ester carboxylesterase